MLATKIKKFIFILILINVCETKRGKRYIYYPYGGGYKMVLGIGIPVMLPTFQSLTFASNIQFQYPQITNLSQIQQGLPPIINRRRRLRRADQTKSERALTYMTFETIMNKYGINGHVCLLRSICENAMYTLNHDANGLYGQLIDILLRPNYGSETDIDPEYLEAYEAGQFGVDCLSLYPECLMGNGLLDFISVLEDGL